MQLFIYFSLADLEVFEKQAKIALDTNEELANQKQNYENKLATMSQKLVGG